MIKQIISFYINKIAYKVTKIIYQTLRKRYSMNNIYKIIIKNRLNQMSWSIYSNNRKLKIILKIMR